MMITLSAKNKLKFGDESLDIPAETSTEYDSWKRCNNDLVISWLLANSDHRIKKSVLFFSTDVEIWKDLNDCFGYSSMAQVYYPE